MAAKIIIPPKKPPKPKTPEEILKEFQDWAKGRTGFTIEELAEIYSRAFNLTPEQEKTLLQAVSGKEPKPQPPTPPKPPTPPTPPKQPPPEELLISRTPYPKWWKDAGTAAINLSGPGSQSVIPGRSSSKLFVSSIVITVSGETIITLNFGVFGPSGPIFLGGVNQPMGIVIALGNSPAACGEGGFGISATGDPDSPTSIGGFTTYFTEKEQLQATSS